MDTLNDNPYSTNTLTNLFESSTSSTTSTTTTTTDTTTTYSNSPAYNGVSVGSYLLILFAATVVVLIWSFCIFFYFSRKENRERMQNFRSVTTGLRRTSFAGSSNNSYKLDPPPTYDIAVNHVEYPIVVVSKDVPQDCLPTYDDVIKCIEDKAKS